MFHSLLVSAAIVLSIAASLNAQGLIPIEPAPLSGEERTALWLRSVAGPGALGKSAFTAAIGQWRDKPHEWGQGMAGYGRRFASRAGVRAATNSIEYGLGALIGEDPRYFPSRKTGFGPRLGHAMLSTFVAPYSDGRKRFAFARMTGDFGGAAVANAWYPPRLRTVPDTMTRAGISVGGDMAGNIFREFWPDLRRMLRRK